jgi:outer membrane cobalamin receptor
VQLHVSEHERDYAVFAQQEWKLSNRWSAVLGLRFDRNGQFGHSVSPRLALVHQRSRQTVYKFVYGRPFRHPSSFEQDYSDGYTYLRAGPLRPETAQTLEASVEHKLHHLLTAILTGYHYRVSDLIQTAYLPGDLQQFQNVVGARFTGAEAEINSAFLNRVEAGGSVSLQDAVNGVAGDRLANSARVIAKARLSVPVVRDRVQISSTAQYLASRLTRAGESVEPVILVNLTATCRDVLHRHFDVQFGLRNLLNRAYDDPVAVAVDRMRQNGRSAFLKLSWNFGE